MLWQFDTLEVEDTLMRGDKVIARASDGRPVVLRVWETTPYLVFVCSEDNYKALTLGERGLWPVGVPREDVYDHDTAVQADLQARWQTDPSKWDHAIPYTGENEDEQEQASEDNEEADERTERAA